MPTQFPAAPRACVKRARVLRARATAAYIAKKIDRKIARQL